MALCEELDDGNVDNFNYKQGDDEPGGEVKDELMAVPEGEGEEAVEAKVCAEIYYSEVF